jgi:hypothetical protein
MIVPDSEKATEKVPYIPETHIHIHGCQRDQLTALPPLLLDKGATVNAQGGRYG